MQLGLEQAFIDFRRSLFRDAVGHLEAKGISMKLKKPSIAGVKAPASTAPEREIAEFIVEVCEEMQKLAWRQNFRLTRVLIGMVRLEANEVANGFVN